MKSPYQQLTHEQRSVGNYPVTVGVGGIATNKLREKPQHVVNWLVGPPALIGLIESKVALEWNPEQIAGWLGMERGWRISDDSIYFHIWKDKRSGGDLYTYRRRQGKKYE